MNWHPEAEKILAKGPPFVPRMARMAVEKEARQKD
ncbi:MAG: Proto-chlorophyllide reductase 57 kD subunit [Eubacteriales bacterium]|nr:Proto-chlorophyllide reductase 57 kD subunit [Eubacteriales bacterium]